MKVNFYLTAKSNPIIEHCCELGFGPYISPETQKPILEYEGWKEDAVAAGLFECKNFCQEVLDFNWLKQDKSPNWNAIEHQTLNV